MEKINNINNGAAVKAGDALIIEGSGFGSTQGHAVFLVPMAAYDIDVTSWSDTRIEGFAPAALPEGTAFTCEIAAFGNPYPSFVNFINNFYSLESMNAATGTVADQPAYLSLGGRTGAFNWNGSDLSAEVAADNLQGVYVAGAGDASGASGAWVRNLDGFVTPEMFGAIPNNVFNCAPAITSVIAYAHTDLAARCVKFGAGIYLCDSNIGRITKSLSLIGAGKRQTIIRFSALATGNMLEMFNLGFRGETTEFPQEGDQAYTDVDNIHSGSIIEMINFTGDRSVDQNCIVYIRNCDNVMMTDVDISYFNGVGLWLGAQDTVAGIRGSVRESNFNKVTFRACGKTDGTASFLIQRTDSPGLPSADAVNMSVFNQIEVIFPYGKGIELNAVRDNDAPSIYGLQFSNIILHGRPDSIIGNNGSLFHAEGYISNLKVQGDVTYNNVDDFAVTLAEGVGGGRLISGDFDLSMPVCVNGIDLQNQQEVNINLRSTRAQKQVLRVDPSNPGFGGITTTNDLHLLRADNPSVTLSGTTPITLDFTSRSGAAAEFFSTNNIDVTLDGYLGLASYDENTFMCDFTPYDVGASGVIYEEFIILNKFNILRNKYNQFTGNWREVVTSNVRTGDVDLTESILPRNKFMRLLNGENFNTPHAYIVSFSGVDTIIGVIDSTNTEVPLLRLKSGQADTFTGVAADMKFGEFQDPDFGYLRMGNNWLWVDVTGNLRIKNAQFPFTDTDGVIVGTQT